MIRNIIFDWSGTLVDDLPATWEATNHVFRQAGVAEISLDQFRAEFCLPFGDFYRQYLPDATLPRLEEWFHEWFRLVQDQVVPLPHAREFLEYCRKRGLRTFLLSSVQGEHFDKQSRATGFGEFLDHPYVAIYDKRLKIHEILTTHGLLPEETVFIGDMQHDIETARHGGVHSCAVLTGYQGLDQLRASRPDLIVEHLGELRELLEHHALDFRAVMARGGNVAQSIPIATVGALIFNDSGDVLMIRTQKWSNLWGIPGGKIKLGEPALDALQREIHEETSLKIEEVRFVIVQDCIHSKEFYRDAHFVLLNYTCRAPGVQSVQLNEEAQEFRWITPAEALKLDLNQPTRILLDAVLASR